MLSDLSYELPAASVSWSRTARPRVPNDPHPKVYMAIW
jgi:hypothetical protein